jgi:hypothetical protein
VGNKSIEKIQTLGLVFCNPGGIIYLCPLFLSHGKRVSHFSPVRNGKQSAFCRVPQLFTPVPGRNVLYIRGQCIHIPDFPGAGNAFFFFYSGICFKQRIIEIPRPFPDYGFFALYRCARIFGDYIQIPLCP